ncbi:MAG TPA: DUF4179 domain-containing protein [Candidatus Blautia excrementigallinarum]|nr:DUF4179 domain-containing protein [Candidatus Blautia excrementigallinarum]
MKKYTDFNIEKEDRQTDQMIKRTLDADFPLPETVENAKREAFAKIREKAKDKKTGEKIYNIDNRSGGTDSGRKTAMRLRRTFLGFAAAAAAFSGVCIVNPAFASNIPVVGGIFETLGNSLGFSGDFDKYAEPAGDTEAENTQKSGDPEAEDVDNSGQKTDTVETGGKNTGEPKNGITATQNGTSVTLSEVYCNDSALYLAFKIETEDKFPDTMMDQEGKPVVRFGFDSAFSTSFQSGKDEMLLNSYLDGQILDENTYAGVLRIESTDLTVDEKGWNDFYNARNSFFEENGIDVDSFSTDQISKVFGIEEYTDEILPEIGGPDIHDYVKEISLPEDFTLDLTVRDIIGTLPEDQSKLPEIPEDIKKAYEDAMAENGLSTEESAYDNFTEEQKDTEHRLFTEMWNAYYERYPEAAGPGNEYENWILDGEWKFTVDVNKNLSDTVTKDIDVTDGDGYGVTSITKTPFEITVEMNDPEAKYVPVVLDAEGELMTGGGLVGNMETVAVQGKDTSTVYVYICDYYEYMDELKGYYWSEDYVEKAKEKTFRELLDERAVAKAEVNFDEP